MSRGDTLETPRLGGHGSEPARVDARFPAPVQGPWRILVVTADDGAPGHVLAQSLEGQGFAAVTLPPAGAETVLASEPPDALLVDAALPGDGAARLVVEARRRRPGCVCGLLAEADCGDAVRTAVRVAAETCVLYDTPALELARTLRRELATQGGSPPPTLPEVEIPGLLGDGAEMREVFRTLALAAPSTATVLITGESGTGKELVARALHRLSPRRRAPFVAVSCAALPETLLESELFGHEKGAFTGAHGRRQGRFELADGGTLFLDEIGEIPPLTQVKLLRVLQERTFERVGGTDLLGVDVRILAATNRDLLGMVRDGAFREDLYYRLNVLHVELPPLRRRRADLLQLWDHFVALHAGREGRAALQTAREAREALVAYQWPGNVRELENAAQRAVVLARGREIDLDALPGTITHEGPPQDVTEVRIPGMSLEEIERAAILGTYQALAGNARRTADALRISERKVRYRLKAYREQGWLTRE